MYTSYCVSTNGYLDTIGDDGIVDDDEDEVDDGGGGEVNEGVVGSCANEDAADVVVLVLPLTLSSGVSSLLLLADKLLDELLMLCDGVPWVLPGAACAVEDEEEDDADEVIAANMELMLVLLFLKIPPPPPLLLLLLAPSSNSALLLFTLLLLLLALLGIPLGDFLN